MALTPKPNNGTLRLPLKPIGLHSPDTSPLEPSDPEPTPSQLESPKNGTLLSNGTLSVSPIEASSAADPNVIPPHMIGVDSPAGLEDSNIDRPVVGDDSGMTQDEKDWWAWFKGQLDDFKGWISDLTHGNGKNGAQAQ